MKNPKVHKLGNQKASKYIGFGHYVMIKAPLCGGAKGLYDGKSYFIHNKWGVVTCKKCLKLRIAK